MRNSITFLFIAFAALFASAKGPVTISGMITDAENEPLEFVTVKITGTAIGTTSGLDGKYTLTAPAADTIRIVFSCIGFETSRRRLVDPSGQVTVNVKMAPASYTLGGIEVTDYQKQSDGMQRVVPNAYRHAPGVGGPSVEGMLTTLAGVNSTNEMSSQYSVRGGSYDENSVYINGIEIYRPQLVSSGQQEGLSVVNPDMVGAIGFSTGGFSARYSDKMSSVLDITYRQPEAFEGTVSASLQGASLAIGSSSRRFSQLHGIRYHQNASLLGSLDEKGDYDPRFFDYQTSMNLNISEKWKLSILGNIAVNNYEFIPHTRTTKFGTSTDAKEFTVFFDGREKDRFETYFGAASLSYAPSKAHTFTLQASGYLTNELVGYDISGEYWLNQAGTEGSGDNEAIGGELGVGRYHEHARNRFKASVLAVALRGNTGLKGGHNLEYGINFQHHNIYDRAREWEMRDSAGYSLPFDPDALKVVYNLSSHNDLQSSRMAFYGMDTWRVDSEKGYFTVNGGLRFSYWTYNREFLVSPRISASFVPAKVPRLTMRFATGLYYQTPFFKEFRQPVDDGVGNITLLLNDGIKSQRSLQFILGADYTFRAINRPFKITGEAYYKALSNLIPYEIDNLKVTYAGQNLSKGYAMGLDFKLFGQFVPGSDSWISFSLMKTNENLNGVNVPRPTDQRYALGLYFTDFFPKFPKLKFNLRGILSDGLPMTAPQSSRDQGYFRAPAYKRVDIGLAYALVSPLQPGQPKRGLNRFLKSAWIGVDVFNLLDISNVSNYYWVTDVNQIQYAVPNYLTRRQFNVRLTVDF